LVNAFKNTNKYVKVKAPMLIAIQPASEQRGSITFLVLKFLFNVGLLKRKIRKHLFKIKKKLTFVKPTMNLRIYAAIVSGWKNFTFPSKDIEKLAKVRAKICASCDQSTTEYPFKNYIPEEKRIEEIKGLGCKLCGCPLQSKLRQVLESCPHPEKKW